VKFGLSKFIEIYGDASDFYRSTSKSDWYFILANGLKLRSIDRTVYMQTGMNVNTYAIKK
jgi:hypothetical protein